ATLRHARILASGLRAPRAAAGARVQARGLADLLVDERAGCRFVSRGEERSPGPGQVLAEQRGGGRNRGGAGGEMLEGRLPLRAGQVVADAIAPAEGSGKALPLLVAFVVAPPALRVREHHVLQHATDVGEPHAAPPTQPLLLDGREGEDRLPEREGEA